MEGPWREIQLRGNRIALVDAEDYDRVRQYDWYLSTDGYVYRRGSAKGKDGSLHRFIHLYAAGLPSEPDVVVHHRNGDRLDNRRRNLEWMDRLENLRYRRAKLGSRSPFVGVAVFRRQNGNVFYRPELTYRGVTTFGGSYEDEEDAARARDAMARATGDSHFLPLLNFPEEDLQPAKPRRMVGQHLRKGPWHNLTKQAAGKSWEFRITRHGRELRVGLFDDRESAASARDYVLGQSKDWWLEQR